MKSNYTFHDIDSLISWHLIQVLRAMRESDSTKPAIFAMSNPTMNGLPLNLLKDKNLSWCIMCRSIKLSSVFLNS